MLKEGLVPLLPERWVLCPRYRITSLFNKTKYKLHQPLWKVKAFFSPVAFRILIKTD